MKKFLLVLAICATGMVANAQFYLGGKIGINNSVNKTTVDGDEMESNKDFGFTFSPNVGYIMNETWEIGGYLNLNSSKVTEKNGHNETINKDFTFTLEPYVRYTAFTANKFALKFEGSVYLGSSKGSIESGNYKKDDPSAFLYGLNVKPMLTYSLNDHIRLETDLNFLGFGLNGKVAKDDDTDTKNTTTNFGLNVDSGNVAKIGDITIGFVYIF